MTHAEGIRSAVTLLRELRDEDRIGHTVTYQDAIDALERFAAHLDDTNRTRSASANLSVG